MFNWFHQQIFPVLPKIGKAYSSVLNTSTVVTGPFITMNMGTVVYFRVDPLHAIILSYNTQ